MKMEVLAVQQQFQAQYGVLGSNKVKDWTSTLTPPLTASTTTTTGTAAAAAANTAPYLQNNAMNMKMKNSIKKSNRTAEIIKSNNNTNNYNFNYNNSMNSSNVQKSTIQTETAVATAAAAAAAAANQPSSNYHNQHAQQNYLFYCDDIDAPAVNELSLRLLDELRAAKSRHLTCTEVSLPCDLTTRIAAEIIRVSEKEPCGIRGCTIFIEFEDEPNNSRRIASLKLDAETVSTFEVYLTLRQDHRGWTALLPQFMKSFARTITISPEFTITKHKLYSPQQKSSYSYSSSRASAAISTPTS